MYDPGSFTGSRVDRNQRHTAVGRLDPQYDAIAADPRLDDPRALRYFDIRHFEMARRRRLSARFKFRRNTVGENAKRHENQNTEKNNESLERLHGLGPVLAV